LKNGEVSFWWDSLGGPPPRRASLPTSIEADVCIVGGGFTGLWTAYYLKKADPGLEIVVAERAFVGYGASGRNGGWLSGLMPGDRSILAANGGVDSVRHLQQELHLAVDEVIGVCSTEGIEADIVKGGTLRLARSPIQLQRIRAGLAEDRQWGVGPDDAWELDAIGLAERLRVDGALGAVYSPHCARIQPAKLVRGLARTVESMGVTIFEATPVESITPHRADTTFGRITARWVLRATEGYTAGLPGSRRDLLPVNSSMIVTEPLDPALWDVIGWDACETVGDAAHAYVYAQRTADGRIALGGRGVPYRYGSAVDRRGATSPDTAASLSRALHRLFPDTRETEIVHCWCGVLGVARDWCASINLDRGSGLGSAGGYVGDGVAAANLSGRTLAELVLDLRTPRTSIPWVGRHSPRWEPEPFRWLGVQALYALYRAADRREGDHATRTSRLATLADRVSGKP
jgi:glycine/D-amino acid oxidase-like deaminating enzyme